MKKLTLLAASLSALGLIGCAAIIADTDANADAKLREQAIAMMKSSFHATGQADMDRLDQDTVQQLCDGQPDTKETAQAKAAAQKKELDAVQFPADGKFLGSHAAGEIVAQNGAGMRWNDKPGSTAGGNCYACHQMTKQEVSFGNLGPSLYQYGKLRGNSDPMLRYTWTKLYNAKAYNACSNMPRFGHKKILTEQQMKDVMALLLDPASPVNQ
jgi:sulfur-oxidizing protein SoxX